MKSIKVEQWGGHEFFFEPDDVREAETPGEVLECLRNHIGIKPYSPMRCKALAETPEGKKLIQEIRRLCEGGGDKEKGGKSRGKANRAQDTEMGG